jgi:glycerol-3-phosphate dehydrogenase (NAD(P)+)
MSPSTHSHRPLPLQRVALLGCGAMAQKVAALLPPQVLRLWGRTRPAELAPALRPLRWCDRLIDACADADAVIFTVPVAALRQVARDYAEVARGDQLVYFVARGVEPGFVLPHTILREETCVRQMAVLGGPMQAFDPAQRQPAAIVVGSAYSRPARLLQQLVEGGDQAGRPAAAAAGAALPGHPLFYPMADMVGVEVAGALSQVTSLAVGMATALKLGDTVRGLLLTRGLAEAIRLARVLGGSGDSFANLAGLGSLVPQPHWERDPHTQFGMLLGAGHAGPLPPLDGVITAVAAVAAGVRHRVELPQVEAIHAVLQGQIDAAEALRRILDRGLDFHL